MTLNRAMLIFELILDYVISHAETIQNNKKISHPTKIHQLSLKLLASRTSRFHIQPINLYRSWYNRFLPVIWTKSPDGSIQSMKRSLLTFICLCFYQNCVCSKICVSSKKYNAEQTVDIYQFISDLKINLGLSNNSRIYTISISLNFDHVIIWMNAINELQVVLPQQFF